MDYLTAVAAALEADPAVRRKLVYRPNSSLYRAGGRLRYAEGRLDGTLRSYHLVAVDESTELAETLGRAREGASFDELAAALVDSEIELDMAAEFVGELIDTQLLVSDLQPSVTGPEPVPGLVVRLRDNPETAGAAAALAQAHASLDSLDRDGLGAAPSEYRRIESIFDALPARPEPSRLFQLDLTKPAVATLGGAVVGEIGRGLDVLARLARPVRDDPLARFRAAFTERYEDREVPLVEVLDEEIGIGFGGSEAAETSPLLAGLALGRPAADGDARDERDHVLLRRLAAVLRDGDEEIELAAEDVDALASREPPPLPDVLEVIATVAAASQEELDRGCFRVLLRAASGAPGARLLGRFCHADDALRERVERHLRAEEAHRPDAVFAEIVHLPEGRLGNILCRPVLRGHEIPFLGRSGAPVELQIPPSDLLVSLVADTVVLRSRRLGREVIPRLTSAHNYGFRSLGLYRFLCELQRQGTVAGLGWTWGPLEGAPFLPRVRTGRTVLARAQWNLDAASLGRVRDGGADVLRELGLPRWIALADYDNELVADLDNPLSVEALLHHLRGRTAATLVELYPGPGDLCVSGPEGRFTHELVIPFVRQAEPRGNGTRPRPAQAVRRSFAPGSEWLYAKLYTGTGTADRVLLDVVEPVVRAATAAGVIERWFFIRYADPQFHVRLRLKGDPAALARDVLPLLHEAAQPLLVDGRIWRLQLDTYERELQRYGGDEAIALSEELFRHDSDAVLAIVGTLWGDAGLDARWRLALYGIELLLDDFGFDPGHRREWARRSRDGFAREFGVDAAAKRALGERYRTERAALEQLFDADSAHPLAAGVELLRERSRRIAPLAQQLRGLEDRLSVPLEDLVASYAHMHVNRLLRGAAREQELVLYDLLDRMYSSRLARTTA
jgi:thiopeptide-type bacteriocin biosynthesis protein